MGIPDSVEPEDPGNEIEPHGEQRPDGPEVVDGEHVLQDRRVEIQAASFSGPLPSPPTLQEYDRVVPGLAREIVDQWKAETAHRHETVTSMRRTDHEAMVKYYEGERRGQWFAILAIFGLLAVAVLAIVLDREAIGVAGLLTGGAASIWAMRRRSDGPNNRAPDQVDDGDAVEDIGSERRR